MKNMVFFLLGCLLCAGAATAGTITVLPDGSGDRPTIQDAIDAAVCGGVVELADGVYTGPGNREIDFKGKAITVRSASDDPALCVIDCEGEAGMSTYGFAFRSDEGPDSILRGVTVTRGAMSDGKGAGIRLEGDPPWIEMNGASPTIGNCVVSGNFGVGIGVVGWLANPSIEGCVISFNTGDGVGTSYAGATILDSRIESNGNDGLDFFHVTTPVVNMERCVVSSNARHGVFGNGDPARLELIDCDILDNGSDGVSFHGGPGAKGGDASGEIFQGRFTLCEIRNNGGAGIRGSDYFNVRCSGCEMSENADEGVVVTSAWPSLIENCRFEDNGGCGLEAATGDISAKSGDLGTAVIEASIFTGNGEPGLIVDDNLNVTVSGCVMSCNSGPGLHVEDGQFAGDILIDRCTIALNAGPGTRSGELPVTLSNSIVAFNDSSAVSAAAEGLYSIIHADIFGNTRGDWVRPIAGLLGVDGNFSQDPLFCDIETGDFSLMSTSPCLDANNDFSGDIGALGEGCDPPVLDIAAIKSYAPATGLPDSPWQNRIVTVEGNVFVERGTFSIGGMYLRDSTGGINFFDHAPRLQTFAGDRIRITGPLWCDSNFELYIGWPGTKLLAHESPPEPAPCSIAELIGDFEHVGDFVEVVGEADQVGDDGFMLRQGSRQIDVLVDPDSGVDCSAVEAGRIYSVCGPCMKSDTWMTAVCPRCQDDLVQLTGPTDAGPPAATAAFALHPCAPNPFNPRTAIRFSVPCDSRVELAVYDAAGRMVRRLIDRRMAAGEHEEVWDGRGDDGRRAAAGVYLCRLEAEGRSAAITMTLVE